MHYLAGSKAVFLISLVAASVIIKTAGPESGKSSRAMVALPWLQPSPPTKMINSALEMWRQLGFSPDIHYVIIFL